MSTFNIDRLRQDGRTLLLSTRKTYSSSSSGVTGSQTLGARYSRSLRDAGSYTQGIQYSDAGASIALSDLVLAISSSRADSTDVSAAANTYLANARRASTEDQRGTIVFSPKIYSFDPAAGDDVLESQYSVKRYARRMISGTLVPYYATENQGKYFAVGNYFTINFFTASCVRNDTAIAFPDFGGVGSYRVTNGVTIDLHLNPRYTTDSVTSHFNAGTIAHLPGCYSLSLATGSSRGPDGKPDKFRLILALTHSADVNPSLVDMGVANGARSGNQSRIFVSNDNIIARNTWNHISVSWSSLVDNGTGRFWVNGDDAGVFGFADASIGRSNPPGALILGNHVSSSADAGKLFNQTVASNEGLYPNPLHASGDPAITLLNPLNAELHSLKIYSRAISPEERDSNATSDTSVLESGLIFYTPPYFMNESATRYLPVSLFEKKLKTTAHPVNVDLMFGCGGFDVNVENFVRDAVRFGSLASFPRLYNLTSSLPSDYASAERNFNTIYFSDPINRKRSLTILPSDDGLFRPSYASLASISGAQSGSFVSYGGSLDYSRVCLTGMVEPIPGTVPVPVDQKRSDPGGQQQTKDGGAYYQVQYEDQEENFIFGALIDISTIHYGHRIKPGSFTLLDAAVTGSCGKVALSYSDDGKNGLYRSDSQTAHAAWNTQGLMYTNEGMGIVLSPTVPFFGKHQWNMGFETEASAHVLTMDVVVPASTANVSQNPTHKSRPPTTGSDDVGSRFVYIDTINVHDQNLNVVARATLAQPMLKRQDEEFLFRLKLDF